VTQQENAVALLRAVLAGGHPIESRAVKNAGEAHGIPTRTLQKARKRLNVTITRVGYPCITYWQLDTTSNEGTTTGAGGGTTGELFIPTSDDPDASSDHRPFADSYELIPASAIPLPNCLKCGLATNTRRSTDHRPEHPECPR
jgi:hypothetical protein